MSEWQPFKTAPKDGTRILICGKWKPYDILPGGQNNICIGSWSTFHSDGTRYEWIIDSFLVPNSIESINVEFTHWMPLPEPPK